MSPWDLDVRDAGPELARPVTTPEIDPTATTVADLRHALDAIARVLDAGERVHRGRWRHETVFSHVAHAAAHVHVWQAERATEDLEHALARLAMACELACREREGGDA